MEKITDGNFCRLTLVSRIKFRIIFLLTASVSESASFADGKLISSALYHEMNGHVKVNKKMLLTETGYEVSEENEKEKLAFSSISYNLLCLYFREPLGIKKVYCDKQECFAEIEKTADGGYKVRFPDGNINTYYYNHGQCVKVKVDHTLYTATMLLTSFK